MKQTFLIKEIYTEFSCLTNVQLYSSTERNVKSIIIFLDILLAVTNASAYDNFQLFYFFFYLPSSVVSCKHIRTNIDKQ